MRPHTLASIAALLRDSRLLRPQEVQALGALARSQAGPVGFVRAVLRQDWLTPYQAVEAFAGRGRGLLVGDYVVLDRLGEGGSAHVFKARHRRSDRLVALKVLRQEAGGGNLSREGWAGRRLAHPNVLRVYEAGQVGQTCFLALEHAEGKDLLRLVQEHGPLPVGRACDYARQAALGLQHAHEKALIHRDVKPANLLLTTPGAVVKVLDLGLALPVGRRADQFGAVALAGTPDYMAPEQALGPPRADTRSDVYGLGCTLFFLLAGRPLFPGGTPEEKLLRHRQERPPDLEGLRPDLPPGLGAAVRRMIAKPPAERYPCPGAAAEALAPFAEPGGCDDLFLLEVGEEGRRLRPEQATVVLS